MTKIIFIVLDGLGDKPIPKLRNKTPLEAAKTPNLDWLAKNGKCGLIKPFQFSWQKWPESDTSHLSLFGYNPKIYYLGRGPYEAAGINFKLRAGDVALRGNLGTVDNNLFVIDRRAGRISETQPLIKALNGIKINDIKFLVKKSFGHRASLIIRGKNLSEKITDADPHENQVEVKKVFPKNKSNEAISTARVLNKFLDKAHFILKNHPQNQKREREGKLPANYLLVRGAGKFNETPSFYKRYKLNACCIAGGALYKGIAKILGMKILKVKGATGLPNTNLKFKFQAVRNTAKKYNFVFCHIKAADSLAEDGNFQGKKAFIEKVDRNIKALFNLKDILIVVTGDHSTCCSLRRHCKELVPFLIYRKGLKPDNLHFNEKECKNGSLGQINQLNLLPRALAIAKNKDL